MKKYELLVTAAIAGFLFGCGNDSGTDPKNGVSSSDGISSSSSFVEDWCSISGNCGSFTDSRDNHEYPWTKLGSQVWMGKNLKYAASGSWCKNCERYGRHYSWSIALAIDENYNEIEYTGDTINIQGICPIGWHIPSKAEWDQMVEFIGGASTAGKRLRANDGSWCRDDNGANFGFNAEPGGLYEPSNNMLYEACSIGIWWASNDSTANRAYTSGIDSYSAYLQTSAIGKSTGYSVRCVQD